MKNIKIYSLLVLLSVLLSSCSVSNTEKSSSSESSIVSESVSEKESSISSKNSVSSNMEGFEKADFEPLFADELPPLTEEETKKVDEHLSKPELEQLRRVYVSGGYNEDVTYGELWRYRGNNKNPDQLHLGENTLRNSQYEDVNILKEFKSIKSVRIDAPYISDEANIEDWKIAPEDWEIVSEMVWIEEVIFSSSYSMGACFTDIPECFKKLVNLRSLKMTDNREYVETLPDIFDSFTKMEYLDLSGNHIKELPESITKMPNLKYLNLDCTRIRVLPENIGDIKTLEELSLDMPFTNIPDSICDLVNLKELILGYTAHDISYYERDDAYYVNMYLTFIEELPSYLPENIGNLKKLEHLEINNLKITTVPESLLDLIKSKGDELKLDFSYHFSEEEGKRVRELFDH